jgi:hypothetical protein
MVTRRMRLLLILPDDFRWTHVGRLRVLTGPAGGASLTQEIPALIKLHMYRA